MVTCTNVVCQYETRLIQDPRSEGEVPNTRAVLGMRAIGRGRCSMESFCAIMDMPPPLTPNAFNQRISSTALKEAEKNMLRASAHLHHLHELEPNQLLDITVTCDGTWSKRGFTATHGIVIVISWETGQVLDFEVLTKCCTICSQHEAWMSEGEFEKWMENHAPDCTANHNGSSPAMEMAGATAETASPLHHSHI